MLIRFNLKTLNKFTYSVLFMFKCELDLLLDINHELRVMAESVNDYAKLSEITETIEIILKNQELVNVSMNFKEDELIIKKNNITFSLN